jgi:hypothetical protein
MKLRIEYLTYPIPDFVSLVTLETSRHFVEATNLYRSLDYQVIENYGQYVRMKISLCMRKKLIIE